MAKNTTVNLRVDSDIKQQASGILSSMGLTFSEAFNLMLHQVCIQQALPFDVISFSHRPNAQTLTLIERIEHGEAEMAGPFKTFKDYKTWLDEADSDDDV